MAAVVLALGLPPAITLGLAWDVAVFGEPGSLLAFEKLVDKALCFWGLVAPEVGRRRLSRDERAFAPIRIGGVEQDLERDKKERENYTC